MATNENLIPIPGRLHSVATEGHVSGANEIYDDTLQKDQATINAENNTALESKVDKEEGKGLSANDYSDTEKAKVSSHESALAAGGSVDTRIAAAVNALDAEASQAAGSDGLSLSISEVDGKITSISGSIASNTYDAYGAASTAKSDLLGDAATDYNTLGKCEDKIQANASDIDDLEVLVPSQATSSNQLADKEFVNSSVSTATATFRGTSEAGLTETQFLTWANSLTKDLNDYVFWNTVDTAGNTQYKRYKYDGTQWAFEYTLNNSSFTAAQWAAIESGMTEALKDKLVSLPTSTEISQQINEEAVARASADSAINTTIGTDSTSGTVKGRIKVLEDAVGTGGSVDSRIANAKSEIKGSATSACDTLGEAEALISAEKIRAQGAESTLQNNISAEISRAQAAEQLLQEQYNALTQSDIIVGALPASGTKNKIYRVPGTTSYSDYMWNGSSFIKMAEYDNAIDDEPTAGSNNLVKSGGVVASIVENTKILKFYSPLSIRLRSVKRVKVQKYDVIISNIRTDVYQISYELYDAVTGGTRTFESAWLRANKVTIYDEGYLEFVIKRIDNAALAPEELTYANAVGAYIREKIIDESYYGVAPINLSIERGSLNDDGTDYENNYSVRVRTELFSGRVHKGDIVDARAAFAASYVMDIAFFDTGMNLVSYTSIPYFSNLWIVPSDGYVRLLIKKPNNVEITDADIAFLQTAFSVYHNIEDVSDRKTLEVMDGAIYDTTHQEIRFTTRMITEFVRMEYGDRVDVSLLNGSPALKFVYVSLYDLEHNYIKNIVLDGYLPYIHNEQEGFVRLVFGMSDDSIIDPSDYTGKIRFMKHDSIYLENFVPFYLPNTFVIGSISGTGEDNNSANRIKTDEFIPVIDKIRFELQDTTNYLFSVSNYSDVREFVGDVSWTTSPITLSKENVGYTRVLIRKANNSDFTQEELVNFDNIVKVTRLSSSISAGESSDILPTYYKDEINSVVQRISENYTPDAFSYAILTDIHDDAGSSTGQISDYFANELNSLVDLSKKTNMLFIGILGDITTGTTGKNNILNLCKQVIDITKDAKCPVFFVRGNHDDSTDREPRDEITPESAIFGKEYLTKLALAANPNLHVISDVDNNCTYYYDFPEQKVRVIAMDNQVSYPIELNQGYLVYSGGQGNWRGINENQIKWLISDALVLPDNSWRVIFLGHDFTHTKLATDSSVYEGGLRNFDIFDSVKAAFNAKASSLILSGSKKSDERNEFLPELNNDSTPITYPSWIINADFSNAKGKIIVESSGHEHSDTYWKDGNGIIQHNVGAAAPHMQWNHWENPYGVSIGVTSWENVRTLGTITEALADIILVGSNKVNRIRFGAKAVSDTKINEYSI